MKSKYFEYEQLIRNQAEEIIFEKELFELIRNYGTPHIFGSHYLKLMVKKDIDISLVSEEMDNSRFFELGAKIADKLEVPNIYYRNSRVKIIPNRPPDSLYFGFIFDDWKIDLWCVPEFYAHESIVYLDKIKSKLTESKRENIIKLKLELIENGTYGKNFSSKELYKILTENEINSIDQFNSLLKKYFSKDIYGNILKD